MRDFNLVSQGFTFDDLTLRPCYSEIISREDPDISNSLSKKLKFDVAIMSANMPKITGGKMAEAMIEIGASGILHRFLSPEELKTELYDVMEPSILGTDKVGISLGVKIEENKKVIKILNEWIMLKNIGFFVIDVSHADHKLVKETVKWFKNEVGDIPLVAGNICTEKSATNLVEWGVKILKVGIGPGSHCITRKVTGVGSPQLSAIKRISSLKMEDVIIIGDGGIRNSGDIVKAYAAGADFVMLGGMLAGTKETPGDPITLADGSIVKLYEGSASINSQVASKKQKASSISEEGISTLVKFEGSVRKKMSKIIKWIKTGLSYCGCKNLKELKEYGDNEDSWERVTHAGSIESGPHGS